MLVLTEGYMDTISMHQYGFDCAVASLGTSADAKSRRRMLSKYTKQMVLCYDGDQAGQNAGQAGHRHFGEDRHYALRCSECREPKDPDEFLRRIMGRNGFKKLLLAGVGESGGVSAGESSGGNLI